MARPPLGHNTGGNFLPDSLLYIRSSVALLLIFRRVNICLGDLLLSLSLLLLLLLLLSGRSFHSISAWVNLLFFIGDDDDWSLILSRLLFGLPAAKRSGAAAAAAGGSIVDAPTNNGECTTAVIIFVFCNALSTTEGDTMKAVDDCIHFLLLDDAATAVASKSSTSSDVSR